MPIIPIQNLIQFYEDEKLEEERNRSMVVLEDVFYTKQSKGSPFGLEQCTTYVQEPYSTYITEPCSTRVQESYSTLVQEPYSTYVKEKCTVGTLAEDTVSCSPSQWTQSSSGTSRYS